MCEKLKEIKKIEGRWWLDRQCYNCTCRAQYKSNCTIYIYTRVRTMQLTKNKISGELEGPASCCLACGLIDDELTLEEKKEER
jgi:hypothetical protein